ncbi:tyrosine--tRNA ligase [Roseiconus lacunae]|uniref:Tyrosine--tRNA ligase n=1 Tax=Roseiconus lacunae TaxID=2605694 RepID=A0ABT7PEJ1_9BACT|nr:tyrosine--tRNA ligase [Roseiconus lacunae]MCD0460014.1 tyrosine--tRNA ligase [Roseiconus lacunae]MDM4014920.1 tyrosine--tRNA ligase [Roseiconus lacunae]WRQ50499.1 tyrosine--tRNA ligase [Stieleria sp. HD01]
MSEQDLISELKWRGLIHQSTDEAGLDKLLQSGPQTVYIGFDPTATSLHVGSLMQLMMLRRFQNAGHRPIALVGGATGMIGDPSGKSEERNLLTADQLDANVAGIENQMRKYLSFEGDQAALLLNNFDWMKEYSYLEFLRDIGKNFPVGAMMGKESVRARLGSEAGLSYTEFSYMLLQAYDFVYLCKNHDCRIQAGGSDQWGNVTAGIDLARRMLSKQVFGLTAPLLTTSDGRKMGKTEKGTVWLDPEKTSPYEFFQYWVNVDDSDVMRCIAYLTEIDQDEYNRLAEATKSDPAARTAQKRLAEWLVNFVHGEDGIRSAQAASKVLFGGEIEALDDHQLGQIFADVPNKQLNRDMLSGEGLWIVEALQLAGLATSSSDARRGIKEGGVYLNNRRTTDMNLKLTESDLASESVMILRRGKKKYALLKFA